MLFPNILEYLDVTHYLKDIYKFRKKTEPLFSYAVWASELNFKSRAHLRSIIIGENIISDSILLKLIKGLKLDSESAEYFTILVKYSATKSPVIKEAYGKTLLSIWKSQIEKIQIQDLSMFLSDDIIPVVFTYLSFDDSSSNIDEISTSLGCEKHRVQNALKCLVWQKLIESTVSSNGEVLYNTIKNFFKIPDSPNNEFLKQFHLNGLDLAKKAHDYPTDKRKYFSAFVALTAEQFCEVQKIIQNCNDQIIKIFDSPSVQNKLICRINTQFFPVSGVHNLQIRSENKEAASELEQK